MNIVEMFAFITVRLVSFLLVKLNKNHDYVDVLQIYLPRAD